MVERKRITRERIEGGGSYFAAPKRDLEFIPSGSKMLDLVLGGGWAEGRVSNIVGDKATGKTLLCIEAAANFIAKYAGGDIKYRECEAAFDPLYAEALGMPLERVDFGEPFDTVEDFFEDLAEVAKNAKVPTLYVLDSLDSLSDREEMGRNMDEGTYGMGKAKKLSQLFRRNVRSLQKSNVTLMVVSQVRSNIGVTFGKQTTRSGGRALDFYSSQTIFLAQKGTLKRTIKGVERAIGVTLKAKAEKNKVGLPFRDCEFDISFGYGIDDVSSCLTWLKSIRHLDDVGVPDKGIKKFCEGLADMDDRTYRKKVRKIHAAVSKRWYEIESSFMPKRKKYRNGSQEEED